MAQWLSWLERRPVTAEVESSSLFWVVMWGLSSAGRASALQAEGHRFEPYRPHFSTKCADVAQLAEQLICNQQVIGSSPIIGLISIEIINFISRDGAVWKLVGLITRRSQVQILLPQFTQVYCV